MAAPQTIKIDEIEYVRKDAMRESPPAGPLKIVVVDRGFVYIGYIKFATETFDAKHHAHFMVIEQAMNVRIFGTKSLGQLALDGPTKQSVLDEVGTVRVPMHAVISTIDVDPAKWTGKF